MRRALVLVVGLVAGCKSREPRERDAPPAAPAVVAQPAPDATAASSIDAGPASGLAEAPPDGAADAAPAAAAAEPEPCVDADHVTGVVPVKGGHRVCMKLDDEAWCVTVDRAGAAIASAPAPVAEQAVPHVDGGRVEVCPPDRLCVSFEIALDDDESIDDAVYAAGTVAAIVDGPRARRVEIWDLDRGRRRARFAVDGLERDLAYDLSLVLAGDAVVVLGDRGDFWTGSLYGLDGRRRALLAGGSSRITAYTTTADTVAALALGLEDVAEIWTYDRATGRALRKIPVTPYDPSLIDIEPSQGRHIALIHATDPVEIELLDAARGTRSRVVAPACQ